MHAGPLPSTQLESYSRALVNPARFNQEQTCSSYHPASRKGGGTRPLSLVLGDAQGGRLLAIAGADGIGHVASPALDAGRACRRNARSNRSASDQGARV